MVTVINKADTTKFQKTAARYGESNDQGTFIILSQEDSWQLSKANQIISLKQAHLGRGQWLQKETIIDLLGRAHELSEVILTDLSGSINEVRLPLTDNLQVELTLQAEALNLPLADYIRGVIYTKAIEVVEENRQEEYAHAENIYANRIETIDVPITKEIRDHYMGIHGAMVSDELNKYILADVVNYLKTQSIKQTV